MRSINLPATAMPFGAIDSLSNRTRNIEDIRTYLPGLPALQDWRGRPDLFGRPLAHTQVGLADQIASAASLLLGQAAEGLPVVLLRGVPFARGDGRAAELIRSRELDLYR